MREVFKFIQRYRSSNASMAADDCPNGPRYKALGNSMAVNVMAWIGQRVQQATAIKAYGV